MKKSILIVLCFFFSFRSTFSQNPSANFIQSVHFDISDNPKAESVNPFEEDNEKLNFSTFKFYISDLQLYSKGIATKPTYRHYLINLLDSVSNRIAFDALDIKNVDSLIFTIGIDSATSVSGVMNGALDPLLGMYWTWQSGYIFLKAEGTSMNAGNRVNFQYHLGGYKKPFSAIVQIKLFPTPDWDGKILIDGNCILKLSMKSKQFEIMSPGLNSHQIMQGLPSCFRAYNP